MGEHLPCKQGVKSSNLSVSIANQRISRKDLSECITGESWYLENCIMKESQRRLDVLTYGKLICEDIQAHQLIDEKLVLVNEND